MDTKDSRQPISVCFISPKSYPLFNDEVTSVFGGAEVDAYLLSTELAKDGRFAVSVIVADYGQPSEETRDGVRIIKGIDFHKGSFSNARYLWSAMNSSGAKVFFLESASPGVPFANLYCRLKGRKWVYRVASRLESDGTYLKNHKYLGRAFLGSLKNASLIVAQNESDRTSLKALTGINARVIPNGQRMPPLTQKEKNGPILWVGRSDPVKRPDLFLALAKRLGSDSFTMVCQRATGDADYDDLKRAAAAIPNLTFIERVPFKQMDDHFRQARVFVNTSDSEGFPNAFIQACKNSTAILSLRVNPDDFLAKNRCGLSCDGDFELLVSSLRAILADQRYVECGNNGRRYAHEKHDLSRIIEVYRQCFIDIVSGQRREPECP
jgi:glycosyltransferase involved in cell wall biosynthesis